MTEFVLQFLNRIIDRINPSHSLLWGDFGHIRKVVVISGELQHGTDPVIAAGELRATSLITSIVSLLSGPGVEARLPSEYPKTAEMSDNDLDQRFGDKDVVLLGSGHVNPFVKLACLKLAERNPDDKWLLSSAGDGSEKSAEAEQPVGNHWVRYRSSPTRYSKYLHDSNSPRDMVEDFGILVVRPNIFSKDTSSPSRLILCFGAHTYGTEAAANLFFSISSAQEIARNLPRKDWAPDTFDLAARVIGREGLGELSQEDRLVSVLEPDELKLLKPLNNPVSDPVVGALAGINEAKNRTVNTFVYRLTSAVFAFTLALSVLHQVWIMAVCSALTLCAMFSFRMQTFSEAYFDLEDR